MDKSRVAVVRIPEYANPLLRDQVLHSLTLLGGLEKIIRPRSRVFVKINHLSPPSPPEKAIVTHPAFTKEILIALKEQDCTVTVGDDIQSGSRDGFEVSGYRKVCDELGINLVNLKESGFRETAVSGLLLDKTFISPHVLEADFIINLPKLKTHSFTAFTGAVKNMFGVIPCGLRLDYHLQYYLPDRFSRMLVDIIRRVRPHLTIMDGITAMEGEGPAAGNPRQVGVLIASRDPVAVDAVACRIIGLRPLDIDSTLEAYERGVGQADLEEMAILGEDVNRLCIEDFKHSAVAVGLLRRRVPQFLYAYLQARLANIPEVLPEKCTDCGECVQVCPTGAAQQSKDKAWIQEDLCIHCMCCHEVCRFQAIKLKQSTTGRLIRTSMALAKRARALLLRASS